MKLTIAKQKNLDEAYDTLIQVCLYDRPLKDMEPFLADDVMNFGAGRKELTKTKTAFLKQIKNQKKLAAGLKMDFQIKPVLRKIINKGDGAVYTDDIVNTVWVNGVKNKLKFRLSFIFEYKEHKWIMVHSHTSTPDPQRSDDEVWPVEELKKRTEVLEKSLDEKIAELEVKNRELEIEAALERVRARTMAMQKSDELRDAVRVIYEQLQHLGFDSNACNIIIIDKESGDMQYWVSGFTQEIFPEGYYVPYFSHPYHEELLSASRQNKKYDVMEYSGEMKKSFDDIFFTQTDFSKIPEEAKTFMKALELVKLSTAFFTFGALQVLGPAELTGERSKILERFAKVFDLTYTRFLDLQKAEAQARESQIQLALERVRARTMAMHKSDELMEAANLLFQQVQSLGIPIWSCGYNIWEIGEKVCTGWMSTQGAIQPSFSIPLTEHRTFIHMNESRLNAEPFYVREVSGEELADHYRYMFNLPDFREIATKQLQKGFPLPQSQIHHVFNFKHGNLIFLSSEAIPEAWDIFKRFTAVFEQTYTRFLDLQKAEAQAREAQIEAALEKVRSRSLAMHKSDELREVVKVVFDKLQELNFVMDDAAVGIFTYKEGSKDHIQWFADPDQVYATSFEIAYTDHSIPRDLIDAKENGADYFSKIYPADEKNEYFKYLFEHSDYKYLPDEVKKIILGSEQYGFSVAFAKNSSILISTNSGRLLSESEKEILKRFAKVFDQAYTRFLDLQKAEAQAKEAQIEAALEKVRSRSLAMHKSDELQEVINCVFDRLNELNIDTDSASILISHDNSKNYDSWIQNSDHSYSSKILIPEAGNTISLDTQTAKELITDFSKIYSKKEKNDFFDNLFKNSDLKNLPDHRKKLILEAEFYSVCCVNEKKSGIFFARYNDQQFSEKEREILKRFVRVFEQSYIRFLDLQKAEAQAREAQIEAALERVRSRTMAMQRSAELAEVATVLFQQVKALGVHQWTCGFGIFEIDDKEFTWYQGSEDGAILPPCQIPLTEHPVFIQFNESRKRGDELYVYEKTGELQTDHYRYMCSLPVLGKLLQDRLDAGMQFPTFQIDHVASFSHGNLVFITYEHFPEMHDVFKRFAKVFDQTYTRFLDLQKAEAQAREAQIEAALERVRSKTMAMHKTDELQGVVRVVAEELKNTGVILDTGGAVICTYFQDSKNVIHWTATEDPAHPSVPYLLPYFKDELFDEAWTSKNRGDDYFAKEFSYDVKNAFFNYAFEHSDYRQLPDEYKKIMLESKSHGLAWAWSKNSAIMIPSIQGDLPSEEEKEILIRFAKVFEQSFIRFLDLQKAEAQAREARIEASLERVRAHAMAMHNSADLSSTVNIFFKELKALGITPMRCGVGEMQEETHTSDLVFTTADKQGELYELPGKLKHEGHPVVDNIYNYWKLQEEYHPVLQGADINAYYRIIKSQMTLPDFPEYAKHYGNYFYFKEGYFFAWADKELSEEGLNICRRFTSVLSLTYKRYNDLKTAEANAREAQIEAALEKVRARVMAMQVSNDLNETSLVFGEQLRKLGIDWQFSYFWLIEEDKDENTFWITWPDNKTSTTTYSLAEADESFRECIIAWQQQVKIHASYIPPEGVLEWLSTFERITADAGGEALEVMTPGNFKDGVYYHDAMIKFGSLGILTRRPINEEEKNIQSRFAVEFERAYTRFLDLKKAEAQTKEAQIETALERVRSRTLAMQKSDELADTASVLFKQLILLGIQPNRLYINIIKDEQGEAEFWITDEDGSKVTAAYTANLNANSSLKKMFNGWKAQYKSLTIDMQGKELEEYFKHLTSLNVPFKKGLSQKRRLQYLAYFSKGFIGMASPEEQPAETMQLLERFAAVFNLTFTRFNDLKIAEAHALQAEQDLIEIKAAKQKAEVTLSELQITQKQLIQSEKMASLGELTAGIAHEIQNPLNFVNNFSDVSNELLEEMKQELAKGNPQQAAAIANDVMDNLEKILHHGKRADAIVKGMLQHSRTSSGQMEPTDINSLCDEYLRLAFHGLRAKDKSFNAKIETDFDNNIGKINVIPQEIGRVILNLINNAFYAVSEKKKQLADAYEPTVRVTTLKDNGKVTIRIGDNGNGIPQRNLDKIFQPFFTTKPTGQGTGLGLSLAYDIITQGHGGELKVETKEGEGSEFTIQLPVNPI